ncbi:hypothetical protein NM688_g5413 [Phlebia brevispora]|uniref:Uncharacterized protein n=1 Tax=Phlebia brevispora TaxID=194682 RepID=A0ACC1SVQ9_9APHY|nr:hypothetical protein NM688_g5413 [Phlebia brevispora]
MTRLFIDVKCSQVEFEYVMGSIEPVNPGTPQAAVLRFTSNTLLHMGHSEVYRGDLKKEGDEVAEEIVCKLVEGDGVLSLRSEAILYESTLKPLQGRDVPRFIGFYCGVSQLSERPIACLLLEYCGNCLRGDFLDHPMEPKIKAMKILLRLHKLGVYHDDWSPHNVVVDDAGNVRVLDFSEASMHTCGFKSRMKLYELAPSGVGAPCPEIYEAALSMEIYTPSVLDFMGFGFDVREIEGPETLVNYASRYIDCRPKADLYAEAVQVLKRYQNHYEHRFKPVKDEAVEPVTAA